MSDTPETDASELIYDGIVVSGYADADVCRKLERERDDARNCFKVAMETAGTYKRERDEARMELQSIVKKMMDQAAVFKREDLRDNSRWSIFNEGRAQALEKFATDLEDTK